MLYLTEAEVLQLLDMDTAVERVEAALVARARGDAVDVPRERVRLPQTTQHLLQAGAPAIGVVGFKVYHSSPHGTRTSHVHLFDLASGAYLAIIESAALGMARTGAASGVATRHLARNDAAIVGQIGAGRQAAGQLEAVCKVRPIRLARVYARTRDRLDAFCGEMGKKLGIEVVAARSAEAAVRGADVVNVITKAAEPVLHGAWLEPGQHVNAAGSNALGRRELDLAAMKRFDTIAVDARATAAKECGDVLPLAEAGLAQWEALPEIGEIAAGLRPGRRSATDLTLYESHGMGIQDLYVGKRVLDLAVERGIGRRIDA